MSQNSESSRGPAPRTSYVTWGEGHGFQQVPLYGTPRERWANSANRATAEVAETRTFKLRNKNGDVYLFTPCPFDYRIVWIRNKGIKSKFTTIGARDLWKELAAKGYMRTD